MRHNWVRLFDLTSRTCRNTWKKYWNISTLIKLRAINSHVTFDPFTVFFLIILYSSLCATNWVYKIEFVSNHNLSNSTVLKLLTVLRSLLGTPKSSSPSGQDKDLDVRDEKKDGNQDFIGYQRPSHCEVHKPDLRY